MTDRAVVLLSGGQDSTTCLFWAKREYHGEVLALSVHYGQRHASELVAADVIARAAGVPHLQLELPALAVIGDSALVDTSKPLTAAGGYADAEAPAGLPSSFVPGRNLLFLAHAAAYAVKVGSKTIVTGVCQTDFSGYPDCRREFIDAMEQACTLAMPSGVGPIKIKTPLMWMTKAETVALARTLPGCWEALALSVTCYHGKRPGCGTCPACELRAKGFEQAGEADPAAAAP
jgi:7-cyano-7-deazaguanine synthase